MKDGPNIARIASLIGDPGRAEALTALLADRAITATELSAIAGVTKQTTSAEVAELLESLMGVAFRTGSIRLLPSPRDPALRTARVCYDHLAGERGVMAYEALLRVKAFVPAFDGLKTHI